MRHHWKAIKYLESGQTMIETVVAVFILVSGIAAAVGLAIYALSSSQNITKQIIAVGLAREGIEAVKNMRDTNWLKQANIDKDCYNRATGLSSPAAITCPSSPTGGACCYKYWLGDLNLSEAPFCLNPTNNMGNCSGAGLSSQNYYLGYDYTTANFWNLRRQITADNYGVDFDSNIGGVNFKSFYVPSDSKSGKSDFFRKIIITEDDGIALYGAGADNPFNKDIGPRLLVRSQVWWTDKKCPRVVSWPGAGKCSVEMQTYLTNWKNY